MCGILRGGGSAALRPVRPDAGLLADDSGLLPPRTLATAAPASRHAGDLADLRNYGVGAALAGRRSRGVCGAEGIAVVFAHNTHFDIDTSSEERSVGKGCGRMCGSRWAR